MCVCVRVCVALIFHCVCVCARTCVCMRVCSIPSIHSSISGYLGCLHVLAIVNHVAVDMGCKYLLEFVLSFIPGSELAGSHGSYSFNFLRKLHTVFYSVCTNLHSYQQGTRIPLSPLSYQSLLFLVLFIKPV